MSREVRYHPRNVELRDADSAVTIEGFATSYDVWYPMFGGPERGGWNERVSAGAAAKTLKEKPDVRLLINHDGLALARTTSGTLTLEEKRAGLLYRSDLDPANPRVAELRSVLGRGDVDQSSFAFRVTRQEWNDDYTERTIREYALDDGDVSVATYPANPATLAQIRAASKIDELRAARTPVVQGMSLELAKAIAFDLRSRAVA